MLLSFRVRNFRSIAGEAVLSLRPVDAYHEWPGTVVVLPRFNVLTVAGIYGANASGKSNIVRAARFMRHTVLRSTRMGSVDSLCTEPFALDTEHRSAPSLFEMAFEIDGRVYRYGFELTAERILSEWLFVSLGGARSVERPLFIREGGALVKISERAMPEAAKLDMMTVLANTLVLPRLDQLNGMTAKAVMKWFSDMRVLSGSNSDGFARYTADLLSNAASHDSIISFLRLADRIIVDAHAEEVEDSLFPPSWAHEKKTVRFRRNVIQIARRDASGNNVSFDMDRQESEGTAKMFGLAGPLTDILRNGYTAFIDELESKLHPMLTRKIIRLFTNPTTNPKHAQLVFVSQDALQFKLGFGRLRRDQIWFCEKDDWGRTDLYCLSSVKSGASIRKDEDLGKKYLEGRYGGIPEFVRSDGGSPREP